MVPLYTDAETGFVYLRARYYDPATGQFLSRDPLTTMTGAPYAYTGGNPLNRTDPTGLLGIDNLVGGAVGFVAGGLGSVGSQLIQNGGRLNRIDRVDVGISATAGGAAGAVFTTCPSCAGAAAGATSNALSQLREHGGNIREVNPWEVGLSGAIGGAFGWAGGEIGRSIPIQIAEPWDRYLISPEMARKAVDLGFGLFFSSIDPSAALGRMFGVTRAWASDLCT